MKNRVYGLLLLLSLLLFLGAAPRPAPVEITVTQGDNLTNICKRFLEDPRKWPDIARFNRLDNPDRIYPGQKLVVPVNLLKELPLNGLVTFLKGNVDLYLTEPGTWQELHLNERISQGSRVKTGDNSSAEITFENGDVLFLKANTSLELAAAKAKGLLHRAYKLFLDAGNTVSKIRQVTGKEARFEIRTPSALAAARGTEFRLAVNREDTTRCEVLEGEVGVAGKKGLVVVKEGEGTVIARDAAPAKPRELLPPPTLLEYRPLLKALPLEFGFKRIEGATSYRITISTDDTGRDIVSEAVIRPQETFKVSQLNDGTYYMRSLSIDEMGLEGPLSAPFAVKVRTNPAPPHIQLPLDGGEYREKRVPIRWLKVHDAVTYRLQLAEDPEFQRMRLDRRELKDVTFTTDALDYGTYYFRACSVANDGFESAWSDTLRFTVLPPPPSPPVEKPTTEKDRIHIRWRHLGEKMTYHFQMSRDEAFRDVLVDRRLEQPAIDLEKPGKAGIYYVRTSTIDPKGYEGEFSSPQSFEIEASCPFGVLGVVLSTILLLILL